MTTSLALLQAMSHAIDCFPEEACGVVINNVYYPQRNVHEDPCNNFLFRSDWVHKNVHKIDHYIHSHTNGQRYPSAQDLACQQQTNRPWTIVCVENGKIRDSFTYGPPSKEDLLHRPYRFGVNDCYTLIRDYVYQTLDLQLPVFPRSWNWWENGEHLLVHGLLGLDSVEIIKEPDSGDIAIVQMPGYNTPHHLMVYLGDEMVLHHPSRDKPYDPLNLSRRHHINRLMPYVVKWARVHAN